MSDGPFFFLVCASPALLVAALFIFAHIFDVLDNLNSGSYKTKKEFYLDVLEPCILVIAKITKFKRSISDTVKAWRRLK